MSINGVLYWTSSNKELVMRFQKQLFLETLNTVLVLNASFQISRFPMPIFPIDVPFRFLLFNVYLRLMLILQFTPSDLSGAVLLL